jgi:hypothetical protein
MRTHAALESLSQDRRPYRTLCVAPRRTCAPSRAAMGQECVIGGCGIMGLIRVLVTLLYCFPAYGGSISHIWMQHDPFGEIAAAQRAMGRHSITTAMIRRHMRAAHVVLE